MWVSIRILEVTQEHSGDWDKTENAGRCAEPPDMPSGMSTPPATWYVPGSNWGALEIDISPGRMSFLQAACTKECLIQRYNVPPLP